MIPTVVPTSTSPSATTIFRRTPSDSASTSCVTLSVSSSNSGSPFATASPSVLSQRTIVPDSMPWPRRGSLTSVAIATPAPPSGGSPRGRPPRAGRTTAPSPGANASGANFAPTRSIGASSQSNAPVLDHRGELRAEASARDRLVRRDAARRLLDGADDRLLVEREERPRVDDLDRDAVLLRLLRRLQRLVDEAPGRDDRDVRALAVDARLAERDRLELLGHLALDRVERPVLEEDDRVVVVDRRPEEAADVLGRRREDDLEPGHVDEPRLELLRVLRARRPARAALRADR